MSTSVHTVPLMVPLAELAKRTNRDPRTIRRWLRRKGIMPGGQAVMLVELRAKWPPMYSALMLALAGPPPCPGCGAPTRCECTVCEIVVT